jgi:hypothetical protein
VRRIDDRKGRQVTGDDDEIARARAAKKGSPFLNTEQAAAYLGIGARKLQYMRGHGEGPRFRRHTRYVRYHVDDLIEWSRSTAGQPQAPGKAAKNPGAGEAEPGRG